MRKSSRHAWGRRQDWRRYGRTLSKSPKPRLLFAIGNLAKQAGSGEAAEAYQSVIRLRPGSVEAGIGLVEAMIELGLTDRALHLAQQEGGIRHCPGGARMCRCL